MRVIISNDAKRLYAKIDNFLLEETYSSNSISSGGTSLPVINANGLIADDYLLIGNPGDEESEIVQISSITNNTITLKAATTFGYDLKTAIHKMEYNQIKFYEDTTLLDTVDIKSDYFVSISHAVVNEKNYSVSFYNSTTTTETSKGEISTIHDRLFCDISDILEFEDITIYGMTKFNILDKINIATKEILNLFLSQQQDISKIENRNSFRQPCALRALYYIFLGMIKKEEDAASVKIKNYSRLYENKMKEISAVIRAEEDQVSIKGQSMVLR